MKDLVVLVPDKNVKAGLDSLLKRTEAFGVRKISYDIFVHPNRDPGIVKDSHNYLRNLIRKYEYAIVCLDFNGSGFENLSIEELEFEISNNLNKNGWQARNEVIVIPCHRVIGRDGSLTGFASGLWRKEWLLKHEEVDFNCSKNKVPQNDKR